MTLRLAEGTYIDVDTACTRIRGGGYGADAWVAKIVGPDPKWGVARQFMPKDKSGMSGSGRSGCITWELEGDGIYEYRKFCVSSRGDETGGFVEIKGTEVRKITRADAIAAVS